MPLHIIQSHLAAHLPVFSNLPCSCPGSPVDSFNMAFLTWISNWQQTRSTVENKSKNSSTMPYTQYVFIRNGLIRNSSEIFRIFKEQLLKILEIRNKFFYWKEVKERAMKNCQFSSKTSDFFWNFPIFSKNFRFFQIFP